MYVKHLIWHNTQYTKDPQNTLVSHQRWDSTKLLPIWPALITSISNALARDHGYQQKTQSKIQGIVKKLKSYSFLCQMAAYLDILVSNTLSLVFKKML